jgi:hypothetical protein
VEQHQVQDREETLRRRLWNNYAVKFPERGAHLGSPLGKYPQRFFQISALGKNRINQDKRLEEQAQPTVEAEF